MMRRGDGSELMSQTKSQFIDVLAQSGNVTVACKACKVARSTAYYWRSQDEDFAAAWEGALAEATDKLAFEARRRALEGVEEVRYFKGEPIGTIRRYSDALLMFLLRAYRPDTYLNPVSGKKTQQDSHHRARDDLIEKLAKIVAEDDTSAAKEIHSGTQSGADHDPEI